MPILSTLSHKNPYRAHRDEDKRIAELCRLADEIRRCQISESLKKKFLKNVVWEMTIITKSFTGRFRSAAVISEAGQKIQRDHVIRKESLVSRLLTSAERTPDILSDGIHCIVTEDEHKRLTAFDKSKPSVHGWARYKECGIEAFDFGVTPPRKI